MSELQLPLRGDSGAEGIAIPAASGACAPPVSVLAPSDTVAGAAESFSLLKRIFSFPAMLGTMLVGAVFIVGRAFIVDPDVWWHAKAGQIILATRQWPTTEPFSFTVAGQPWIDCEWLGDVLIGGVGRVAGLQGLDALLILLGSAIMVALYVYATLRSGNSKAGFLASTLLFLLATTSFSLRPQMLGYLFIILTLIALERFRQGRKRALWLLPGMFLLWINAHGSWVIGLGIIFVVWASGLGEFSAGGLEARRWSASDRRRLSFVLLLCLAVIPLTPYGTQIAAYPFEVAFKMPLGVGTVSEWQTMPFNLPGGKLFLALLLGFLLLQVAFRPKWRLDEFALFLFGTMMACLHVRFLLIFVPFFAPLLAEVLTRWLPAYDRKKDQHLLNGVLMSGAAFAMVWFFPGLAEMQRVIGNEFPVKAVTYLRQHSVPGPIYNNYNFGTYLLWSDYKIFIDGRSDIYERGGVFADYLHISRLRPGALTVLRAYRIQACLLEPDEPLATMLSAQTEWQKAYADNLSVLFVRRDGGSFASALSHAATPEQKE
jgi:hypothetical protein